MISEAEKKTKPPASTRWLELFFVLFLLGFGSGIFAVGLGAIQKQHYELNWKSRGLGGSSQGTLVYEGRDAIRMGAGLMSFGAMLCIWGLAMILSLILGEAPRKTLWRVLCVLSFACLVGAFGCFYPPWQTNSLFFYSVVVIVGVFFFAVPVVRWNIFGRVLLPCLIVGVILTGTLNSAAGLGMGLGLVVAIVSWAHVLFLFPDLLP